jgi:hypothetical protein
VSEGGGKGTDRTWHADICLAAKFNLPLMTHTHTHTLGQMVLSGN